MATLTVYGDPADNRILSKNGISYSNARAGTGLTIDAATNTSFSAPGQELNSGTYYCMEGFIAFDTSSLPDGDVVSAADLSVVSQFDNTPTDFTMEARAHDWGPAVETADWVAGANLSSKTLCATLPITTFTEGTRYTFTAQSGFFSSINNLGFTRLLLCSDRMTAGIAPPNAEWVSIRSGDQTGTTNDPTLTVTHAPPPAPSAPTLNNPAANVQLLYHRPITFSWTHNSNGGAAQTHYRLRIDRRSDGASRFWNGSGWQTTSVDVATATQSASPPSLPPDFAGESVDWLVATTDSGGISPWGGPRRLHPGFEGFGAAMV